MSRVTVSHWKQDVVEFLEALSVNSSAEVYRNRAQELLDDFEKLEQIAKVKRENKKKSKMMNLISPKKKCVLEDKDISRICEILEEVGNIVEGKK